MSTTVQFIKRHPVIAGILLMFLLTWPIDLANAGVLPLEVPYILSITFGWGLLFASLLMSGLPSNQIIGEHGNSQVPVWSLANIAESTRCAAYEIIKGKGATYYAIAAGLVRIVEAIVRDENSVLTVSGVMGGAHGLKNLAVSLPCVINRQGIARTLELPLSDEEEAGLARSAGIIQSAIESLNLDEQISIGKIPSVGLFLEQKEPA